MAKIYNFPYVQATLRQHGLAADTPEDAVASLTALYPCAGSSTLAERAGVTSVTIRRWLREQGVRLQPRGGARCVGKPVTIAGETRLWREWFPPDDWPQRERHALWQRLVRSGWTIERALTEPLTPRRRKGKRCKKL